VDTTDRQLAHIQAASDRTRRLIRKIAAEGADDSAPARSRRRATRSRALEEASE
jgi:hypothetical protein